MKRERGGGEDEEKERGGGGKGWAGCKAMKRKRERQ